MAFDLLEGYEEKKPKTANFDLLDGYEESVNNIPVKPRVTNEVTRANQNISGISPDEFKNNIDSLYDIPQVPMPPRNNAGYTNSNGEVVQTPPNLLQTGINAVKQIPQVVDAVNAFKNNVQQPVVNAGRAIARPMLPKGIENNFLGSQADEALLKRFDGVQFPSWQELDAQYKSGAMPKDVYIQTLKDKLAVENARLDKGYRNYRNTEAGKEALLLGLSIPAAAATATGTAVAAPAAATQIPRAAQLANLAKAASLTGLKEGAKFGAKYGAGASLIDEDLNPITEPIKDAASFGAVNAVLNPILQGAVGAVAGANKAFNITGRMGEAVQKAAEAIKKAPEEFQNRTNPNNWTKETVYEKNPFNKTFEPKERWQYKPKETPEQRNITPEPKQISGEQTKAIANIAPKTAAKIAQEGYKPKTMPSGAPIEQGARAFSALPQNIIKNNTETVTNNAEYKPKQYKVVNGKTVKVDAEPTEEIKKIAPKTTEQIERVKNTENLQANETVGQESNANVTPEESKKPANKLPTLKYKVTTSEDGLTSDGLYMEGSNFHSDGNAAFLNEFVNADTSKVAKTTKAAEQAEQQVQGIFEKTGNYTLKAEDIGKGFVTPAKRGYPKETKRVFQVGNYDNGEPRYVVVNDKYLLDKKDIELYVDNDNLYAPISVRKNGKQIGVVMPIMMRGGMDGMVDIPQMKSTAKKANQIPEASKKVETNQDVDANKKVEGGLPETKKTTVTMKSGKEREIEYVEEVPEGFVEDIGAMTAPRGYTWYHNDKSILSGERKSILVKDKAAEESSVVGNNEINIDARQIKSNETSEDFVKRILDTKIEKYKPTTYTIDWGSLRSQQQGKRSNGMVKGSMGDMTLQGEKEYKHILGGLPEYENIKNEFGNSVEGEQMKVAYLKAREAGFNQEESLDFAYTLFEPENLLYKKLKDNIPKENNPTPKEVKETGKAVEPKEVKKSEPKKKEVKKKESKKLDDAGEFLQGNRKQDTSLTWDELKDMNDLIRAKNTTKAKVYPKPSIEDLKSEGFTEFQAGVIQNVYNKINAKPAAGYDKNIEHQKQYVDTIKEVMDSVKGYIKSHPDEFTTDLIAEAARKYRSWSYDYNKSLFDAVFPDTENKKLTNKYSSIFRLYPEYNRKAIIVGGNKFTGALQLDNKTLVDVMKAIEDSKKVKEKGEKVKKEPWEKNFVVLEPDRWNKEYAVANKNSKQVYAKYATKEEAIAAAKRVQEKIDAFKDTKANFVRDYVERRENNKDVTTEELREAFGFRGVNFGNWTNEKERQNFVNFAYDSLYDLAELLNLPPKALSLNGQLGLAYGAQGTGGKKAAAAHYIPEYKDINLTKEYGAGSLAHEWWHALDNYFGNQATNKEYSREWALSLTKGGDLRPEVFEALENLQTQIKKAPFTEEDIKKRAEQLTIQTEARIKRYADSLKQNYAKAQNAVELHKIIDDLVENKEKYKTYSWEDLHEITNKFFKLVPSNRDTLTNRGEFGWFTREITRLNEIEELARKGANKTEYLQNAEKADKQEGGKYWSEDTELGARAFAAYIFDKMANQNIENRFLSRSGNGAILNLDAFKELAEGEERESLTLSTTPKGEERARIFKAFDKLFNTIKTRPTEKGVELYDIDVPSWMNDYKYTAKGYKDIDLETLNSLINKGCTQDELLSVLPSDLHSAFRNIKGYKFYNFRTDDKGIHYGGKIKEIGINLSKVGNNPRKFVDTLMHEVEHADQEVYYNYLKNKNNLTPNEIEFIKAYKRSNRLNRVIMQYLKDNKLIISKVVNPFLKKNANLSEEEFFQNVNNIKNKLKRDIIKKHIKYIDKYWDLFREVGARESGKNYSEVYIDEERSYDGRRIEKSNTHIQNSSANRNIGATIRSRFRGNDENLSIGGYRGEVNKNTSDEISKVIRDKVYDWHGNLESDRYDIDKALNSFINLTKHKAKNISGKTGLKVTDKQLREIMPFLRERTGFPETLERDDLRTLFNKLDKTDKAELTKLADSVSDKFEKYYKNYKEAKGEQTEESIENHISHIWDLDDKKKSLLTNFITTNSKFAKQRTIGTLVEGIDGIEIDGEKVQFKPKTLDYAEILKSSSDNLIKATHDSILANEIKNLKYRGESLVLPAAKAPSEWVEVNHPALNKAVYMGSVGKDEIPLMMKNPVKVHPEIADYVSAIFEVQKNSKFWTAFDSLNGMIKQGLLGFSGFHGYALSESSIGNAGVGKTLKELNPKKFVDAIKNGNYDVYKNEEAAKRAIKAGVQLGTPSDLQRNLVEETLKKVPYLGNFLSGTVSANNKILWDVLHNNFKVLAFNTAIENLGENVTKEQERAVAQWVNDSFGGQAWELLGIKKSTIKAASRVLLSPDWNFSTIRQAAAAINSEWLDSKINQTPLGKRIGKLTGVSEETSSNGARGKIGKGFWIRSAIFFIVFYNLINAAFREKDRKEHPELYPKDMKPIDYSIWSNSYPMDNIYDRIMPKVFIGRNSDGTSRMLRVGKQFREVPEFLTEPVTKLGGKTSPLINIASQVGLGMGAGDIVKRLAGGEAYLNQDIWDGYGEDAKMRSGVDLAKGRAKALGKSLTPFIASKYIGGKHEPSAWDFFAQTNAGGSKSRVYKQTMEALKSGQEDKIRLIKRHAYQDGMKPAEINKMVGYATKTYQAENSKRYKKDLVSAIESRDKTAALKIKKDMEKHKLSKEEQRRILEKAFEEYQKSKKN